MLASSTDGGATGSLLVHEWREDAHASGVPRLYWWRSLPILATGLLLSGLVCWLVASVGTSPRARWVHAQAAPPARRRAAGPSLMELAGSAVPRTAGDERNSTAAKDPVKAEPKRNATCAKPGEDCRAAAGCCEQGAQCYFLSAATGAQCRQTCKAGDAWLCQEIGNRALQRTPGTWAGEDCSRTMRCNNLGLKCFRKDSQSAYCTQPAPADWDGTVLGGDIGESAMPPAAAGQEVAGASLFCFMAVLPGSTEEKLRDTAKSRAASIYSPACDGRAAYPSFPSQFVHAGSWNSFANTDSFIKVWEQLWAEGLYKKYDWTVKVDPDCVFMPDRLKWHLQNLKAPAHEKLYIKNCDVDFGFLGAIEILSKGAVDQFFESHQDCRRTMPGTSGEDGWLKGCLDAIGARYLTDSAILKTPWDTACWDNTRVAFHPHKDPGDWAGCHASLTR